MTDLQMEQTAQKSKWIFHSEQEMVSDMKEWNIVTFKNGKRKDHHATTNDDATCQDVATWFDMAHNGDEGEILEIVPIEQ